MSHFARYLLIGHAAKMDWGLFQASCARAFLARAFVYRLTVCGVLALTSILSTAQPMETTIYAQGAWVDGALSETLTRKFGCPVRVRDAYFPRWGEVSFGSMEIRNARGRLLVSADSGSVHLRRFTFRKDGVFETEVTLVGARLMRDYYGSARPAGFWSRFLHKPLNLKRVAARIRQSDARTAVQILDCQSEDLRLEGQVVFDRSGAVHDSLKTSMGFWRFLRSVV